MKKFSIVLPIYKNEENLPITVPYILDNLKLFPEYETEIIMVCDGSPDKSYEVMKQFQSQHPDIIKIAKFVRNKGQRAAVNCGFTMASGDVIGVISADLQDPFEKFVDMLRLYEQGEKLVIGYREDREDKGLGSLFSVIMHKFINKHVNKQYPAGGFDFYVVDRTIAEAFTKSDSDNNSMQLLLLELAGHAAQIGVTRKKREVGSSGWSLSKRIDQVLNIVTVYSDYPFRKFLSFGIFSGFVSLVFLVLSLVFYSSDFQLSIYMLLFFILFFLSAIVLGCAAMLGLYQYKAMRNEQRNPRYIVDERIPGEKDE